MKKQIKVTNPDAIKKLKDSVEKKNAISEHIRSGKKLSDLPKELGVKFVDPLADSKLHGRLVLVKVPHGNFPVPKSRLYWCEFMRCYHDASERTVQQDCCFGIKPIVVSDEVIKPDEWMYDETPEKGLDQIRKCPGPNDYLGGGHHKILMMPIHFSPEQIQMIIENKLNEGDPIKI